MSVGLVGMTSLLLVALALAVRLPGLNGHVRRPFELLDRASLLLGFVLGSAGGI